MHVRASFRLVISAIFILNYIIVKQKILTPIVLISIHILYDLMMRKRKKEEKRRKENKKVAKGLNNLEFLSFFFLQVTLQKKKNSSSSRSNSRLNKLNASD